MDADVLAWFRGQGKKYQTYTNEVLRREMQTNARGERAGVAPYSSVILK